MSPESPVSSNDQLSSWPFPHVYAGFKAIKEKEAPRHEHWNTIESVELLLQYKVAPFCERIVETPVMMTLAQADNITSADLETQAFNAITNPNKSLVSVEHKRPDEGWTGRSGESGGRMSGRGDFEAILDRGSAVPE